MRHSRYDRYLSRASVYLALMILAGLVLTSSLKAQGVDHETVTVFLNDPVHFNPDNPGGDSRPAVLVTDNGRLISTTAELPEFAEPVRITAHVSISPIPKDHLSVHDKWDRAGSIKLISADSPDIELVKFVTAYGGQTDWSIDVSQLAPLLQGRVIVGAFIDTWVSPAWLVDFSLEFTPDSSLPTFHWVLPLFMEQSYAAATYADTGLTVTTAIPSRQQRVMLYYLPSGHCTDGRGPDEFVRKDHVLAVDDKVLFRYQPWRDDCRQFREINPYTKRWSDGWWSSDYPRSGWCPGDLVEPLILDFTDHLDSGRHTVGTRIEGIRPRDENDQYGYWRVSGYLVGKTDPK